MMFFPISFIWCRRRYQFPSTFSILLNSDIFHWTCCTHSLKGIDQQPGHKKSWRKHYCNQYCINCNPKIGWWQIFKLLILFGGDSACCTYINMILDTVDIVDNMVAMLVCPNLEGGRLLHLCRDFVPILGERSVVSDVSWREQQVFFSRYWNLHLIGWGYNLK